MKHAHLCGLAPSEFWRLTPWQSRALGDAEAEKRRHAYNAAMAVAWHGEALARRKTLPSLKSLLMQAERKLAKAASGWEAARTFLMARVKRPSTGSG